jgi:hypothetical protein
VGTCSPLLPTQIGQILQVEFSMIVEHVEGRRDWWMIGWRWPKYEYETRVEGIDKFKHGCIRMGGFTDNVEGDVVHSVGSLPELAGTVPIQFSDGGTVHGGVSYLTRVARCWVVTLLLWVLWENGTSRMCCNRLIRRDHQSFPKYPDLIYCIVCSGHCLRIEMTAQTIIDLK